MPAARSPRGGRVESYVTSAGTETSTLPSRPCAAAPPPPRGGRAPGTRGPSAHRVEPRRRRYVRVEVARPRAAKYTRARRCEPSMDAEIPAASNPNDRLLDALNAPGPSTGL